MEARKPGRPNKGVRTKWLLRMPPPLAARFDAEAERQGVHRNDLVIEALAVYLGESYALQERLPLTA